LCTIDFDSSFVVDDAGEQSGRPTICGEKDCLAVDDRDAERESQQFGVGNFNATREPDVFESSQRAGCVGLAQETTRSEGQSEKLRRALL